MKQVAIEITAHIIVEMADDAVLTQSDIALDVEIPEGMTLIETNLIDTEQVVSV
jgi:hypothetical protein